MRDIHFYATGVDLLPVLARLEEDQPVKYIPTGMRSEINRPIYLTWRDIPDIGVATNESGFLSLAYMVSARDIKNVMYTFVDNKGRKQWLLSSGDNPDCVLLAMAGIWKTGTLLPGNMRTMHNTPTAQRIMKKFSSAVKAERFAKYGVYWFGREAVDMLQAGRRLVQAEQSPSSFDIPKREHWSTSDT